jgi:hypothetical protein
MKMHLGVSYVRSTRMDYLIVDKTQVVSVDVSRISTLYYNRTRSSTSNSSAFLGHFVTWLRNAFTISKIECQI